MNNLLQKLIMICATLLACNASASSISAFGDLLYWQASQQTESVWATVVKDTSSKTINFKGPSVAFGYNWGFRGGIAYQPNNFWDSRLYWTYFKTNASSNLAISSQLVLPEFFSGFLSQNFFFGGNVNWRLIMNMFDYNLGHTIKTNNGFTFRPCIGIKTGTINQRINANWLAILYTSKETVKHNFFGIGPSLGFDTKWNLYGNWNLIGNFSGALMWGNWKITDTYQRPFVSGIVTATTIVTNLNNSVLGTLMLNYLLGIEWQYPSTPGISVSIGYEMQYWANQLRLPTFQQLPVHGDLTLQGATCRVCLSF